MSFNYDHKSIQMRRGTSSEWREYGDKCVPLEAEICVELMQYPDGTINKNVGVKVGNGIDSYEQLPYVILNEEVDPVFTNHPAYQITQDMIDMWNQASVEPGEEYGQVTRWDGSEWVPSSIILLKDVEGIEVHRNIVPDRKSSLDVGASDLTFKNGYFDNLDTGSISVDGNATIGGDIDIDGSINIGGNIIGGDGGIDIGAEINNINKEIGDLDDALQEEIKDRIEGDKLLQGNIDGLADDLAQEIIDRQEGDSALGERIDNLATDDLTDVNSASAKVDQFLIHNGFQWVAEDFHIDTELAFKGGISVPNDPAPTAENGDLYINNEEGIAGAGWTGIAGRQINPANAVGWSATNSRWYMLGDIATSAVTEIREGTAIKVDAASDPSRPIVSLDKALTNSWYTHTVEAREGSGIRVTAADKGEGFTSYIVAADLKELGEDFAPVDAAYMYTDQANICTADFTIDCQKTTITGQAVSAATIEGEYFSARLDDSLFNIQNGLAFTNRAGNALFIDGNGEGITAPKIKKLNGTANQLLCADGSVVDKGSVGAGQYTLPLATNGTRGGVQVGYATSGRNYAVQLSGEKMFVNVPWTDTDNDTTYSQATSTTLGLVKIGATGLASKNYAVALNGSGQMYVAVPWTDTQPNLTGYATEAWVTTNHYKKTETKKNVVMTEAAYNGLATKDAETVYFLT